jgi:hypothetical protein
MSRQDSLCFLDFVSASSIPDQNDFAGQVMRNRVGALAFIQAIFSRMLVVL